MSEHAPEDTDILYISSAAAQAAAPTLDAMRDAVERMFLAKVAGTTFLKPKLALDVAPGRFFQSLVGG